MRSRLILAATLLAALALLAGCGKSTVNSPVPQASTPTLDQAEIAGAVAAQPEVVEDAQFESDEATVLGGTRGAGGAQALAAIDPLRFWRKIDDVQRTLEYAYSDPDSTGRPTTAVVTVHKALTGTFNLLTGVIGDDGHLVDSTASVVHKPLSDHWVRRILLKRFPTADSTGRRWHVVATSCVKVTSREAQTRIVSLRVQSGDVDTTLTDPLAFHRLRHIPRLAPGTDLKLTVTTLRNDDVVVLCRFGHRARFENNGDNTYTWTWNVPDLRNGPGPRPGPGRPPVFHFGVNALSNGTLFDDEAPYDSQAWLLPVVMGRDEVAEAL